MNNNIFPCLWFDETAKEAAGLYCSVFEKSKIDSISSSVVTFELEGKKFMGLNGGKTFKLNPSISLYVSCESIIETDDLWNKLLAGGKELMPIDKYPWSDRYGWLQDKFGLTWQISIAEDEDTKPKIRPSMLFTNKQFGRAEESINFYNSIFDNSSTELMIHYPLEHLHAGKVLYSEFKLNCHDIIAMDGPGSHNFTFNEAFSFVVECETQQEIDYYWHELAEGGQEGMCGWLKDKFGVSWQVVPSKLADWMLEPERAERISAAFMKMKKLDLNTLLNA